MNRQNRTELILGLLLILAGAWFVASRQVPALRPWANLHIEWPFYVIGAGALMLILGLLTGRPRMAIPASLVAGVGGILWYQNQNQDWESWSFMWTLIFAFVGIGVILAGLLGDNPPHNLRRGLSLLVLSAALFLIFVTMMGRLSLLGDYGAAAILIFIGLYIIGRGLFRARPREREGE
jgi:peptidoglycan/LPS O-acetylase OafA/YrhL